MGINVDTFRAVVVLPAKSGIVADETQHTFTFSWTDEVTPPDASDFTALTTALSHFYKNVATGAAVAVNVFLAPSLDVASNKCRVEYFRLPTAAPGPSGPPEQINLWTLTTTAANGLPNECAAALTLKGLGWDTEPEFSGSTRPRARKRGRIYIGPLGTSVTAQDATTKRVSVDPTFRTSATKAAKALASEAAGLNWAWGVLSRVAWEFEPVVEVHMDDAIDIQRRRGEAAQVRTTETF